MNNAWSIALRVPCRGLSTAHWTRPVGDGLICRSTIANPVAKERQQWARRSFGTTSWLLANKLGKHRKEAPRSSTPSKTTARRPPPPPPSTPPSAGRAAASAPKKAEKATVQLSQAQVASILGTGLTFDQGMDLLQEIQYRRVTGSLSDKGLSFPERPEFSTQHTSRALDWLRENYPVDEEAAAYEYAEELAATERKELEERARRLRIYRRDDGDKQDGKQAEEEEEVYIDESYDKAPLRPDQTRDITSGSALTARKEYVEASRKKAKIEAEKVAEEYEARGEKPPEPYRGHDLVVAKKTALEETRQKKHERWEKLAEDAMLKQEDLSADRSAFSRLWAPVLFGLAVVGGAWAYADSYEPPKSSMRFFPSISPAVATVVAMAGVNLVVLVMWRNPNAWKFMNRYLLLSPGHPKAFSILGALFSHQQFSHLAWNMGGLYLVGCAVHEEVGRGTFLALFLTSGISGYLSSLTLNVLTKSYLSATLGASAAIFGLVGAYFTLAPTRSLTLPDMLGGKIEFSSWLPLVLFFAQELLRWRTNRHIVDGAGGGSDHITHLGGLVAGAVAGWWVRRRLEKERSEDGAVMVQSSEATPGPFSSSVAVSSTSSESASGSSSSPSS